MIKKCINCGRLIKVKPSEYSAESGINKVQYIEVCPYCDKNYKVKQNKGASGSGS